MSTLDALGGLTRTQLEDMLSYLRGWDRVAFDTALAFVQPLPLALCPDTGEHFPHDRCPGVAAPALPRGHGENHTDNAGHVISACIPGECITCHGHVTADGVFHAAGAA